MQRALFVLVTLCILAPGAALAHTGVGSTHGLLHGLMHPITGLDHVLAIVAVGVFAALLGGRALWLIPASFVVLAAVGGVLGMRGAPLPLVELGIATSVIVLGLAIALQVRLPVAIAAVLVGLFGAYHGFAHGAEMPIDASGLGYGLGFLATTAMLILAGIGLGSANNRLASRPAARLAQAGGSALALAGIVLLARGL